MLIDTDKEAEEYFEHNPDQKKVYFLMIDEDERKMLDDYAVIDIEMNLIGYVLNK